MTYEEAVGWLYDMQYFGMKLGLENTRLLLDSLGNPHERFGSVHVAGTNGKGSTCAFVSSILERAGRKVGRYTSPHLTEFGERIAVNGFPMTRTEIERAIARVRPKVEGLAEKRDAKCTFFETTTAMAFDHFARRRVDRAAVEVGMGGRLDSTNVITPEVAVITNVSKEHTRHLGRSLAKIATEKAGIINPGIPTVCGAKDITVLKVVAEKCKDVGSELLLTKDLVELKSKGRDLYGSLFDINVNGLEINDVHTRLAGEHQLENIGAAVLAVSALKVTQDDIRDGIESTSWPARLQVARREPLVMLDTTHNPGGARTLARYLDEHFPKKKPVGIIGLLEDKDAASYAKELDGCFSEVIATQPSYHRGRPAEELAEHFPGKVSVMSTVKKAVDKAMKKGYPVIVTGSIFTASDAVAHLDQLRVGEMMGKLAQTYAVGAYPGGSPKMESPPENDEKEPFRVLITTILSQRTRDENTRVAARNLYDRYKTPKELAEAKREDIEPLIRAAGFPGQKAEKIIQTSKVILEEYGGKVPDDIDKLVKLPGVGRKTANCVLAYGFRLPAIAVDTHVHRMTNLWGLARTKDPEVTEKVLIRIVPKRYWLEINRLMVRHGQRVCNPVRPRCGECRISHLCDYGLYYLKYH